MSVGVTTAATPNCRNSGPAVFVLLTSAVPVAAAAIVLLPHVGQRIAVGVGRAAGQRERRRVGIVVVAGAVTTGAWSPVSVTSKPWLPTGAALGGLADEAGGAGHVERQRRHVRVRERAAERDLEAGFVERARPAERSDRRGRADRQYARAARSLSRARRR